MDMELFHELLVEIEQIPATDIHTHIRADLPAAPNLSEIVLCPYIRAELETAGVSAEVFEIEEIKKRVLEASKHFGKIENTTSFWCLTHILRDLYGLTEEPHEADMESLSKAVEQTAQNPEWASNVLEKANVSNVFLVCDWRSRIPEMSRPFVPTLRIDSLINEAHNPKTMDTLTEVTEQSVYDANELRKAIARLFESAKEAGAVAATVSVEPGTDFVPSDRNEADRVLSLMLLSQKINRDDRKMIRSYVMDQVLKACADHKMPLQLMLGVRQLREDNKRIAAYEPGMMAMYADLFARHDGVKFDVFSASEQFNHELAVIARLYPNVYASGYWWYQMFPERIRSMVRERVQMLPMTKSCGFFSDARCVEWLYSRAKLARWEITYALTEMVEQHYIEEGPAVRTARCYLQENPARIYGLSAD